MPSSVRSARLFVVDRLQEWRCDDLVDRAALLTSELATNAVVHTGQPFSVLVDRRGPTVRVEVVDRLEQLPRLWGHGAGGVAQTPADKAFSGLGILAATATTWGTVRLPGKGKVVWFELEGDEGRENEVAEGLRELRDSDPWSLVMGQDDDHLDDWLTALGGPRLPRWAREGLVVLATVCLVALAILVRG